MSVDSVSFYQQDQNYWSQARAQSAATAAQDSLINVIGTAMTNLAKGKASIANGIALKRVNSELVAAVQSALGGSSSTSGSSNGSSGSASTSSSNAPTGPSPATGTGTVPVTTSTSLSSLGILPGGKIAISAGAHLTTYVSTGTDTIADLINFINVDLPTNAQVTASLNTRGDLVIKSRNTNDTFVVTGTYAQNIGFGPKNSTFEPVKPKAAPATPTTTNTTSSTASSKSGSGNRSQKVSTPLQQNFSTAASILAGDGVSGSLVDLLA